MAGPGGPQRGQPLPYELLAGVIPVEDMLPAGGQGIIGVTLRKDAPLFRKVDEIRWKGATPSFPAMTEKLGDPRLLERCRKLETKRQVA